MRSPGPRRKFNSALANDSGRRVVMGGGDDVVQASFIFYERSCLTSDTLWLSVVVCQLLIARDLRRCARRESATPLKINTLIYSTYVN